MESFLSTGSKEVQMKLGVAVWFVLSTAMAGSAFAGGGDVITVLGLDDPGQDRANIQAAVDSAAPGDTVRLIGTFRLDGERITLGISSLTVEGEELDNDGDGRVQEDWADDRDNDGDGRVDEDDWETWIFGVDAGDGTPVLNDGTNGLFNRGLVVDGAEGELRNLTIRQLAFSTFHRAIELVPEWFSPTGRCEDRVAVAGSLDRVRIEDNRIVASELGITLLGAIDNSTVERNVFADIGIFGAVVEGGEVRCPFADGSFVDLALSTPSHNRILANEVLRGSLGTALTEQSLVADNEIEDGGILSLSDRQARLTENTVRQSFFGFVIDGGRQVQVDRNRVVDSFAGLLAGGDAEQVFLKRNEVSNAFFGIDLFDARGFTAINNVLTGGLFIDVTLSFDSSGNTVINNVGPPITVEDLGFDNRLIGDIIVF